MIFPAGSTCNGRRSAATGAAIHSRVGAGARIDGTWRSSGQIVVFLNDIPARAAPQSHVGMARGNEHQYLQGDSSALFPARSGCARSHTPKAITTAPARANQVMAYCR